MKHRAYTVENFNNLILKKGIKESQLKYISYGWLPTECFITNKNLNKFEIYSYTTAWVNNENCFIIQSEESLDGKILLTKYPSSSGHVYFIHENIGYDLSGLAFTSNTNLITLLKSNNFNNCIGIDCLKNNFIYKNTISNDYLIYIKDPNNTNYKMEIFETQLFINEIVKKLKIKEEDLFYVNINNYINNGSSCSVKLQNGERIFLKRG